VVRHQLKRVSLTIEGFELKKKKIICFIANENEDIIDEAIKFFRANIFFRNYDIKVNQMNICCCFFFNQFFSIKA